MVAVALLTVVAVSLVGVFATLSRQLQGSKARTLATNLAQEKMQILKEQNFNRVLVTTATAYLTQFSPNIPYDTGYYPPETILEGGMYFTRYTYIEVAGENSGSLVYYGAVPDTGMKAATVSVVWKEGTDDRKLQMRNIIGNINNVINSAVVKGQVTIGPLGTSALPGGLVTMAENVGYQDSADASGNFLINLLPGSYTMATSAHGYFPSYQVISVAPNATLTQNVQLIAMGSGTVQGAAWVNDHIVISQVVGSTRNAAGFCQEFVEAYNPTNNTILVNGGVQLKYAHHGDSSPSTMVLDYTNDTVGPDSYYLFANTSPVVMNGITRIPDAVFDPTNPGYPDIIHVAGPSSCAGESDQGDADAIGLSDTSGNWLDAIGWTSGGHTPLGSEQTPLSQTIGLQDGEQFIRKSSTAGVVVGAGRAYDSDNNNVDWVSVNPIVNNVYNTGVSETPIAGRPAVGAYVTATDGLSQLAQAVQVGSPPYAQFQLTSVATGTWTVYVASAGLFMDIKSVSVTANTTTAIPNSGTTPAWPAAGNNSIVLTSAATQGYVTGWVLNTVGGAITPAITVSAGAATASASTANGNYLLALATGTYDVQANVVSPNTLYVNATSATITVNPGAVTSGVNFTLSQGGKIRGFITRDGVNPLPGIVVAAANSGGATVDQEVSGSDGRYLLINLSTGDYVVSPALDSGEIATPSSATVTVAAGTTVSAATFTITGAFGTIKGSVSDAGQPIKTGVLIVCSTMTIVGNPPVLSNSSLSGASTYVVNSYEDGTYSMDVRESTSTTYRLYAYYPKFNGSSPAVTTMTVTGISVTAGQTRSGVDFAF